MAKYFLILLCTLLISCSSAPVRDIGLDRLAPRKAEQELSAGIKHYEEGEYAVATQALQKALDLSLAFKSDQVTAHKYLAFIYCVTSKEKLCREQFRRALEIDAKFELKSSEIGHPLWGPVFRSVKGEVANKTKYKK